MNTFYIVVGDNGSGNSGNAVFGIYPTEALAEARIKVLQDLYEDGEGGAEYVYMDKIENVGTKGADCDISVCG